MISAELLRNYRSRWLEVEEIRREELRTASIELRWKQLNALFALGRELGLLQRMKDDEMISKERWNRLRRKLG